MTILMTWVSGIGVSGIRDQRVRQKVKPYFLPVMICKKVRAKPDTFLYKRRMLQTPGDFVATPFYKGGLPQTRCIEFSDHLSPRHCGQSACGRQTRNPVFPHFLQKRIRLCLSFLGSIHRQKVGFHFLPKP
jgi:hypothetical protein